jgi:hypothetical protein
MVRRKFPPFTNKKFLGNSNTMEVHDLDNEDTRPNGCQIDEIIRAGHAVVFNLDTLQGVRKQGYDKGNYCLGGSRR